MFVTRTEQHRITRANSIYKTVDEYCFRAKNVYNLANYIIRQEFINNGKWLRHTEMDKMLQRKDCYKQLGSQASQKVLQLLDKNWKSFVAAIKDWSAHKEKYLGKPKLPKYLKKSGRQILQLKNTQCSLNNGVFRISFKPFNGYTVKSNIPQNGKLQQCRFVPRGSDYMMEIVYQIEAPDQPLISSCIACIDLGINNFATITNNIGLQPIIIKGGVIKSINQYYNKRKAELQSELMNINKLHWSKRLQQLTTKRNNKVKHFMHVASRRIVDYCLQNNIDTLICGINHGWKQESKMNRQVNQNFVNIPYDMFINQLAYKCENIGIMFITTEESYTSGTSFLDGEEPIKENYNKSRRRCRGLFVSNNGTEINADVNGSYQIMKKVFPNAFAEGIEGVGLHPTSITVA